jgi:hypothetical protein
VAEVEEEHIQQIPVETVVLVEAVVERSELHQGVLD